LIRSPGGARRISRFTTEQRSCSFYIAWFNKLYVPSENGWYNNRTPDDAPLMDQDAYFWRALEIICATNNLMMIEARNK
jgi:hypothetical protein